MEQAHYLDRLIKTNEFGFRELVLSEIDNAPVLKVNRHEMKEEMTSLFYRDISNGDDYFAILHSFVSKGLSKRCAAPVARFADGEYAFYAKDLHCNGLYQQAESVGDIKESMPKHIEALKLLNRIGKLAPLIYPGNVQHKARSLLPFLGKSKIDSRALRFTDFLYLNGISLTKNNYVPFYVVYAYLTSKLFSQVVDKRELCIIGSDCNMNLCRRWFANFSCHPSISFAEIPESYVATKWNSIKDDVLARIPGDTDLCLVGAGIGSVLVCVDVANAFSIPAIDAGHVLNMLNGREDKSNGPRLYTIHNKYGP